MAHKNKADSVCCIFKVCKYNMALVAREPVVGVSDKAIFKPVCSASVTSYKIEISPPESLDTLPEYSQAGLRLCCSQTSEDRFSGVEAHMGLNNFSFCIKVKATSSVPGGQFICTD